MIQKATANGVPGTLMPAFAKSQGGMLTDQQIAILAQGVESAWAKPAALRGQSAPPYAGSVLREIRLRGSRPSLLSVRVATAATEPGSSEIRNSTGSLVDPAYLALISDQGLRSLIIAGQPEDGMPDWRSDMTGAGSRPLTDKEITDIVAWLDFASSRSSRPALCASIDHSPMRGDEYERISKISRRVRERQPFRPKGKAQAHTRRVFLFKLAVGLNAVVGAVLAVPLIGYLLGPASKKTSSVGSWISDW